MTEPESSRQVVSTRSTHPFWPMLPSLSRPSPNSGRSLPSSPPSLRKCRPSRLQERVALRRHPCGRAVAAECATPTPSQTRSGPPPLRAFPVTIQARSFRAAPVAPPRGRGVTPDCWALRSPHAPAFGLVSLTLRPEARKEVGTSVRKVPALSLSKGSSASTVSQSPGIPL